MAMEVGAAYVSIVPSFKGFGTELAKQIKGQTSGVGEKAGKDIGQKIGAGFQKAGKATDRFGKQVTTNVTLPVAGIAAASFQAFASFDQTIRQAGAALDLPAAGMDNLSKLALKMGKETSFSAGAAADAMLALAKGGMTAAQIQGGGLQQTLTLAAAGGLELGSAATYMTNTLNTFGLGAKDAGRVAAALAGGANASTASVESLGAALSQVGPGARNAGLDLNQTVGTLALFDQYGIKGSDAGTSLKTMLSRLVPQTAAAAKAMKQLGLDFTDAQGNIVPIGNVADQLKAKLSGLSEAQRTTALNTIFGSDASRAASVLMQSGSVQLNKMTAATKDLGAAQRLAAVNTSGASGSMEQLKGSLETAGITIGRTLAPHVTVLAQHVTELANQFSSLDAGTQRTILVVAGLAAAAGPTAIVLGKVTTGVGQTITGVSKLASATGTAAKSMVAFGTGIAQPQSGLSMFASNAQRAGGAVGRFGQLVGTGLGKALAPAGKGLAAVAMGIRGATAAAWAFVATPVGAIIAAIVALAVIGFVLYKKWTPFHDLVNKIGAGLVAFGQGALQVGRVVISALVTAAVAVGHAFQVAWSAIVGGWNAARPVFATILNIVLTPLRAIILFVKGWINIIAGIFTGDFKRVGTGIGQALAGIVLYFVGVPMKIIAALAPLAGRLLQLGWSALVAMSQGVARGTVAVLTFFAQLPGKAISAAISLVSMLGSMAWNAFVAFIQAEVRGWVIIGKFFASLPGKAIALAGSIVGRLASLGRSALSAMGRAIASAAGAVWSFFTSLPGRAASFISSLPGRLATAGRNAISGMSRAISSAASSIWSFFSGLPGKALSALGNVGGLLAGAGRDLVNGMVSGIKGAAGAVASAAKDMVSSAITAAKNALVSHSPSRVFIDIGKSTVDGFVIGMRTSAPAAAKATTALVNKVRDAAKKIVTAASITPADRQRLINEDVRLQKTLANNAARYARDAATKKAKGKGLTTAQLAAYRREDALARTRRADIAGDLRRGSELATAEIRAIGKQRDTVIAYVNRTAKALAPYRAQLDVVNKKIADTTARLTSLREARASVFTSIRDTTLGARDLFGSMMDAIAPDPAAVVARMKANLAQVTQFQANLSALFKKGLSGDMVQQIAAQGAQAGGQMAEVLLKATPAQIKDLNSTFGKIGSVATSTGNVVAGGMYDAGIKAAEGLLKGLQSRQKQLTDYLTSVANRMVSVLRNQLGIKSPSRVMERLVGSPVGLGIVSGLEGEQRTMDRALQSFVSIPRAGSLAARLQPAGVAGSNVRVFIGERELTDIVRIEVDDAQTSQVRQLVNGRRV